MPDPHILLSLAGNVATITFNNPKRHNALGTHELVTFRGLLEQVASDNSIRVLIITGTGNTTFCAGGALNELSTGQMTGDTFAAATDQLADMAIPTICALNGNAYGGGVEVGLACDFRIGPPDMKLHVPPARIGICYPVNGIQRFVTRLGSNIAKRLLLAGEEFTGEQLYQAGYLTHLSQQADVMENAMVLARQIASLAPLSLVAMKAICNLAADGNIDKAIAQSIADNCNGSEDAKEGFLAIREKRAPDFRGV